MNILPSFVPIIEVISISVGADISVAYKRISLWTRILGPEDGDEERPIMSTETGVQMTKRCDISSTNTPGFGLTTAT
jgi:hypothetical protein